MLCTYTIRVVGGGGGVVRARTLHNKSGPGVSGFCVCQRRRGAYLPRPRLPPPPPMTLHNGLPGFTIFYFIFFVSFSSLVGWFPTPLPTYLTRTQILRTTPPLPHPSICSAHARCRPPGLSPQQRCFAAAPSLAYTRIINRCILFGGGGGSSHQPAGFWSLHTPVTVMLTPNHEHASLK